MIKVCYYFNEVDILKKIKNFIKTRSKLLFISFIISAILFVLILPEFLYYSDFIDKIVESNAINTEITDTTLGEIIWSTHATEAVQEFNLIFSCIFVFITLFNLVGYLYNKSEFIFISIGLSVIATCMSIYVSKPIFIVLILLATILNFLGYVEQNNMNKQ